MKRGRRRRRGKESGEGSEVNRGEMRRGGKERRRWNVIAESIF